MAQALGFENLLAFKEPLGIGPEALDKVFALWELIEARSKTGEDRAALGTASRRELKKLLGPGEQAVHMCAASSSMISSS